MSDVSTLTITKREKVSRADVGYKEYVECYATADDLDGNGYPKDPSFPVATELANGSNMMLTDSKKVKIWDEANLVWREW